MGLPPSDQSEWLWQSPRRQPAQLGGATGRSVGALLLEVHEVGRRLPGHRLGDDPGRGVAHAGQIGEPPRGGALGQHGGVDLVHAGSGAAEGAHLVGLGPRRFEQVGDAAQGHHGIHEARGYRSAPVHADDPCQHRHMAAGTPAVAARGRRPQREDLQPGQGLLLGPGGDQARPRPLLLRGGSRARCGGCASARPCSSAIPTAPRVLSSTRSGCRRAVRIGSRRSP